MHSQETTKDLTDPGPRSAKSKTTQYDCELSPRVRHTHSMVDVTPASHTCSWPSFTAKFIALSQDPQSSANWSAVTQAKVSTPLCVWLLTSEGGAPSILLEPPPDLETGVKLLGELWHKRPITLSRAMGVTKERSGTLLAATALRSGELVATFASGCWPVAFNHSLTVITHLTTMNMPTEAAET